MANIGDFDPNAHEPSRGSFEPLPAGWYGMQAINSGVEPTKSGTGNFLKIDFEVLENMHPEHKGRLAWERLNLWNPSEGTVTIANGTLTKIARSVGQIERFTDSSVLHFRPIAVKLKVKPASNGFKACNEAVDYDSIASRFPTGAASAPSSAPGQPPARAGSVAAPPLPSRVAGPPVSTPAQAHAPAQAPAPARASGDDVPPWERQ